MLNSITSFQINVISAHELAFVRFHRKFCTCNTALSSCIKAWLLLAPADRIAIIVPTKPNLCS